MEMILRCKKKMMTLMVAAVELTGRRRWFIQSIQIHDLLFASASASASVGVGVDDMTTDFGCAVRVGENSI